MVVLGALLMTLLARRYGNSRLEAAPSDIQRDKGNRGLSISISLEFFLSFEDQQPRVRVRVDLLTPSALLTSPSVASFASANDPAMPANVYDPSCPSISLRLPQPAQLPIPLSALATLLSAAHSHSRKAVKHQSHSALSQAAVPYASSSPSLPTRDLAYAIDLFKRMNGEVNSTETAEEVEAHEKSVLERLKGRLRRRKKAPGIVKGGADGTEPGGRKLEGTNRLPEGQLLCFRCTSSSLLTTSLVHRRQPHHSVCHGRARLNASCWRSLCITVPLWIAMGMPCLGF